MQKTEGRQKKKNKKMKSEGQKKCPFCTMLYNIFYNILYNIIKTISILHQLGTKNNKSLLMLL